MRLFQYLIAGLLTGLLAACGGGGGSGNNISLDRQSVWLVAGTTGVDVTTQTVQVSFQGAGVVVGTLPGQAIPAWLSVKAGAVSGNSVPIDVSANPEGLPPGNYSLTLRFATGNADKTNIVYQDLVVTLTVVPIVTPASVSADAVVDGAPIRSTINVIADKMNWVVKSSDPWIAVDRSESVGSGSVGLTISPMGLTAGNHTGSITIEDTVSHAAHIVPITLGVDARRLVVRRPGVALSLVGDQSRLSTTVMVTDNGHVSTNWLAISDQSWLQMDKSEGSTDGSLTLTANATGLPDGLHFAKVTIAAKNEPAVTNSVVVRVGLYVDRAAPFIANVSANARVPSSYPQYSVFEFIGDPIRPYFYHSQGDGQIDIYNAYTAARVGSISIPGAALGGMVTTLDGSTLFVVDHAQARIYPIDLDTRSVGAPFSGVRIPTTRLKLAFSEVNGLATLVTSEFQAIDAQGGVVLADAKVTADAAMVLPNVVAQRDGRAVFFQGTSSGNHGLARYALGYRGGVMRFNKTLQVNERGDGHGLALSADDSRLFAAAQHAWLDAGGEVGGYGYSTGLLEEVGHFGTATNWASGVATSPNENVYVSMWTGASVATYQSNFVLLGSYSYGLHTDALNLSGDAHRLGLYVQDGMGRVLHFTDVP